MKTLRWILLTGVILAPIWSHAFVTGRTTNTLSGAVVHWNLTNPPAAVATNVVNPTSKAIRYFLTSDAYSAGNAAAELNALRACFGQWMSIPGTVLKFEEAGVLPGRTNLISAGDGTNWVYWEKTNYIIGPVGGTLNINGVLGFCSFTYALGGANDGVIKGADIVLNGLDFNWHTDFTNTGSSSYFVEGVALHEMGHLIGLNHSPVGGATMLWVGSDGIGSQPGVSPDDIAGARWLYGTSAQLATLGGLSGTVTTNGIGILGAVVSLEDTNGNLIAGGVSAADGTYLLPAVAPGSYFARVTPLEPINSGNFIIRGSEIVNPTYNAAVTNFLSTTNFPVTITANATNTQNFAVVPASQAYRITHIRAPTTSSGSYSISGTPVSLVVGQSNFFGALFSPDLPTSGATLTISGNGVTVGTLTFQPSPTVFSGLNGISFPLSIASNATPGLRSFVITKGTNLAYANGFFEVQPAVQDYNLDGLDDAFQRKYFSVFTSANAAPAADPDGDGFPNLFEYVAGTLPTNSLSLLKVQSTVTTVSGTTVTWQSVAGKRYQVSSRANFSGANWGDIGSPVAAVGATAQYLDATATSGQRFYRVRALP